MIRLLISTFFVVSCLWDGVAAVDDDEELPALPEIGPRPSSVEQLKKLWPAAVPGQHYPALTEIPTNLTFSCAGKKAGWYADESTQCQVYHRCKKDGTKTTKICNLGKVFHTDRSLLGFCDWWYNSPCGSKRAVGQEWFIANSPLVQGAQQPKN